MPPARRAGGFCCSRAVRLLTGAFAPVRIPLRDPEKCDRTLDLPGPFAESTDRREMSGGGTSPAIG